MSPKEMSEASLLEMLKRQQPEQPNKHWSSPALSQGLGQPIKGVPFKQMILWFCHSSFCWGKCPPYMSQFSWDYNSTPALESFSVYPRRPASLCFSTSIHIHLAQLEKPIFVLFDKCIPYFSVTQCNDCTGNNNPQTIRVVIYLFLRYVGNQ